MLGYLFCHNVRYLEDLIELGFEDEHFMNCLLYILSANQSTSFIKNQMELMGVLLDWKGKVKGIKDSVNINFNDNGGGKEVCEAIEDIDIEMGVGMIVNDDNQNKANDLTDCYRSPHLLTLMIKVISDRDLYHRYFNENINNLVLLIKLIIDAFSSFIPSFKVDSIIYPLSSEEDLLTLTIKLTQNLVLDLEEKAKSLKKKDIKDVLPLINSNNYHKTVNNPIETWINGFSMIKPRETILSNVDHTKDYTDEDDSEADEILKKISTSFIDDEKSKNLIIEYAGKAMGLIAQSFVLDTTTINSNSGILKTLPFGMNNLLRLQCFTVLLEVFINLNYLACLTSTEEMTIISDLNTEAVLEFIDKIMFCCFRLYDHSILHKEVEFLIAFLSNKHCPVDLVEAVFLKCKFPEMFKLTQPAAPNNIVNLCEIMHRLFSSTSERLVKTLQSKLFNIAIGLDKLYLAFYKPVYAKMNERLPSASTIVLHTNLGISNTVQSFQSHQLLQSLSENFLDYSNVSNTEEHSKVSYTGLSKQSSNFVNSQQFHNYITSLMEKLI